MKHLLALITLWSLNAHAQDACESVWVYKNYGQCLQVPDRQATPILGGTSNLESDWVRGGSEQGQVCLNTVANANIQAMATNENIFYALAQAYPVAERDNGNRLRTMYKYTCVVDAYVYPLATVESSACGGEAEWQTQRGGPRPQNVAQARCMSCDEASDATQAVNCLAANIRDIVEPDAADLRRSDLRKMASKIDILLEMNQKFQANPALQNDETRHLLQEFLDYAGQL